MDGIALITGAAGGIGSNTAFSFAEAGAAAIVFADFDEKGAQEAAEKSKSFATNSHFRTMALRVDVTDPSSVQSMVDATVKEFGRIDYNVNSAGIGVDTHNPVMDASVEEFEKLANINTKGTMLCVRAVSKAMSQQEAREVKGRYGPRNIGRGSIVNLGSGNSYVAVPGHMPYTSSKHAVIGITKSAALDNGPHGIRVNAVCPSWVEGPMMDREFEKMPQMRDMIKAAVPLGRMAQPEEVGDVIRFLCSPEASYINGVGLLIDGGVTLTIHVG